MRASASAPRTVALLLVAVAVLYCSWPTALALPGHLDPTRVTLSAVAARGQPYAWVYRTQDSVAGLLALVATAGLAAALPATRAVRVGLAGWVAFGAGTLLDALVPMGCAPHDPGCAVRLSATGAGWRDDGHALTSVLSVAGLFVAVLGISWGLRADPPWGRYARGWLVAVGPLVLVALYSGAGSLGGRLPAVGVDEWLLVTGLALFPATLALRGVGSRPAARATRPAADQPSPG